MNIRKILTSILPWKLFMTYELAVWAAVLNTALLCNKRQIFHSQNGTILIKYNYKDWILLVFFSHSVMKDRGSTWTLRLSYHYEKKTSRIQSQRQSVRYICKRVPDLYGALSACGEHSRWCWMTDWGDIDHWSCPVPGMTRRVCLPALTPLRPSSSVPNTIHTENNSWNNNDKHSGQ